MSREDLRHLPSVPDLARLLLRRGRVASEHHATSLARTIQDRTRAALLADESRPLNLELDAQIDRIERLLGPCRLRRVINATGIVIHTNLGRAAVSTATERAMAEVASSAVALEIEPETGRRGGRMDEISDLVRLLTGAEATLVVNNNAAAILLVLTALASGRNVAISRSEAVEIGGGFRIPDVLSESGARLVEVGTTNRTYADDYRRADISGHGVILRVHASNFAITGFTARPTLAELRQVANECGALLVEDLGSGTLVDTATYGIDHEPTVTESLEAGVDVVTFSGDKLLGGPQAGIVAGRADLLARVSRAPLARAVRADKTALAGVAETLRHYVRGDAEQEIPVLRMLRATRGELEARAADVRERLARAGVEADVVGTTNFVGGGALPGQALPGVALRIAGAGRADALAKALRTDETAPVYARIEDGDIVVELRTVSPADDDRLAESLGRAARAG